jgi:prefoldin subunit 5
MTATDSPDALRAEIEDLDRQIAELKQQAAEARRRIGQQWDAPTDQAEIATGLQLAEEAEAFIRALEDRRERLAERLGAR